MSNSGIVVIKLADGIMILAGAPRAGIFVVEKPLDVYRGGAESGLYRKELAGLQ